MAYIYIKHSKCAGCGIMQSYPGKGLRVNDVETNWKLLLACSTDCAQKFVRLENLDKSKNPDILITKNGMIPYREITQTHETTDQTSQTTPAK